MSSARAQRPATSIVYDESQWPIVIARFPVSYTSADIKHHINAIISLLSRQKRFGMVYALEHARLISAPERKLLAKFIGEYSVNIKRWVAGCAIASSSTLHRGALTALGWLVPLPFPTHVCQTVTEGKAWLEAELEKAPE